MWKKGSAPTHLRPVNWAGSRTNTSIVCWTFATRLRWVSIAPFDTPGVPPLLLAHEVHDDDGLQVRIGQHSLHPLVHVGIYDDGFGAGVIQNMLYLALYVHGVDLGDYGPEPHGGEEGDHILRAVREHERDPISLLDPARRERGRHLLNKYLQPLELEGSVVEAQRSLPTVL